MDFVRVERVPSIAQALIFATRRVASVLDPAAEVKPLLAAVFEKRELLLASAVALAAAKVLDPKAVARIQAGTGPTDAAQDCIDLAALFRANAAAVAGRTPVSADDLRAAAELGMKALEALKPGGVAPEAARSEKSAEAAAVRDRMGALLTREYAYAAKVGGYLWGHGLGEHMPPLRSRSVGASAESPAEPVTPTPPADPTRPA